MVDNRFFYISGLISFLVYSIFVFFIVLYINQSRVKKYNSISKDTVIELDLIINKQDTKKKELSKAIPVKKEKTAIFKKSKARSAKQKTNLKSLFAKVSVKAVKIREKKINE